MSLVWIVSNSFIYNTLWNTETSGKAVVWFRTIAHNSWHSGTDNDSKPDLLRPYSLTNLLMTNICSALDGQMGTCFLHKSAMDGSIPAKNSGPKPGSFPSLTHSIHHGSSIPRHWWWTVPAPCEHWTIWPHWLEWWVRHPWIWSQEWRHCSRVYWHPREELLAISRM